MVMESYMFTPYHLVTPLLGLLNVPLIMSWYMQVVLRREMSGLEVIVISQTRDGLQ